MWRAGAFAIVLLISLASDALTLERTIAEMPPSTLYRTRPASEELRLGPLAPPVRYPFNDALGRIFDFQELELRRRATVAELFARSYHDVLTAQRYGQDEYSLHLELVQGVLRRWGFNPESSRLALKLSICVWLHDVLEDTSASFAQLVWLFGHEIADIVWAVTKVPLADGMTSEQQVTETLRRTATMLESRLLKLADRVANVERGLFLYFNGYPTKVDKYVEQWPAFHRALYRPGEADFLWQHLNRLLNDEAYARAHVRSMPWRPPSGQRPASPDAVQCKAFRA